MSKLTSLLLAVREDEYKNDRFYSIQGVHLKLGDDMTYILKRIMAVNESIKQNLLLSRVKDALYVLTIRGVTVGVLYFDPSERYLVKFTTTEGCLSDCNFTESYYHTKSSETERAITTRGTRSYNGAPYTINGTAWGVCLNSISGDTEYSLFPNVISGRAEVFKENIEVDLSIYESKITKLTKTTVADYIAEHKRLMADLSCSTEDARQAKKEQAEARQREREAKQLELQNKEYVQDMARLVDIGIEVNNIQNSLEPVERELDMERQELNGLRNKLSPYISSGYVVECGKRYQMSNSVSRGSYEVMNVPYVEDEPYTYYREPLLHEDYDSEEDLKETGYNRVTKMRQENVFKANEKYTTAQALVMSFNTAMDKFLSINVEADKKKSRIQTLLKDREEILNKRK